MSAPGKAPPQLDKKGHYTTKCPEPRKDRDTSENRVPSQGRTETPQKTSDSLGNLRVDETNVDSTQRGYSQTSSVHPVPYHLPRESVSTLLDSGTIRSTEFASKKEGDCNVKVTGVTYKPHPDIKSSITTSASSYFHVMTTSWPCIAARVFNKSRFQWW